MPYGECKIYFDGSHYIGIPHTTRPSRRRSKPPEEEILVTDNETEQTAETEVNITIEESAALVTHGNAVCIESNRLLILQTVSHANFADSNIFYKI